MYPFTMTADVVHNQGRPLLLLKPTKLSTWLSKKAVAVDARGRTLGYLTTHFADSVVVLDPDSTKNRQVRTASVNESSPV